MAAIGAFPRVPDSDYRVRSAFLTPRDVAVLVDMTESRAYSWARQGRVATVEPKKRGWPSIPLLGLAEFATFSAWNAGGLSIHQVMAAADWARREYGKNGFLSRDIMHDGVTAYLASRTDDELETIIGNQYTLRAVIEDRLEPFDLDSDGLIYRFKVERIPGVVIDPRFNAGRMMFETNAVPLFAVAGQLSAGEPPEVVADDYGLTHEQVQAVIDHSDWLAEAS